MKISTTFRHKTQNTALKEYVQKSATSLEMYTNVIHRVDIVFAIESNNIESHQTSCHIALHLLGKENIDIRAVCKRSKDAFDQAFNLVRCELSHANKYRLKGSYQRAV